MKVCMLVLNPFTHDTRVRKEAHSLAKAGFDVTVWALGASGLPVWEMIDGFQVKRLTVRTPDLRLRPPGLVYGEMVIEMTYRLSQEQAEVYHAHDALALIPRYLAARLCDAYLIYDATMAYPNYGGFRCGTCHPFRPLDIEQNQELDLWEHPLITMDAALKNSHKLTPEQGKAQILELAQRCREVGGMFTLFWHNTSLDGEWSQWGDMYRQVVQILAEMQ
jgi:hypothetical protein